MANAGTASIRLRVDRSAFERDIADAGQDLERKVGSNFGGKAVDALSGLGKAAAVGFGLAGTAAAAYGLKVASSNEQAAVSFETILGSAEKATAFLSDLKSFAAQTPFELPGLQDAAARLAAVGVETGKIIPLMSALGDATAGMGTGAEGISRAVTALTQMQQKGKVTGEEMMQLTEAGIPAWDALATVMGTDVPTAQAQVTAGQVKVNTLFEALETRAGPAMQRLNGLMEKQSQTFDGMLSTLKDTAGQGLAAAMTPALVALKGLLPQITDELAGLTTATGEFVKPIVEDAAPIIGKFLSMFSEGVTKAQDAVAPLIPLILTWADAFADGLQPALTAGLDLLVELSETVGPELQPVMDALAEAMAGNGDALADMVNSLEPLVPVVGDLVEAGAPLVQVFVELLAVASELGTETFVSPESVAAVKALASVVKATIGPVAALQSLLNPELESGTAWVDAATGAKGLVDATGAAALEVGVLDSNWKAAGPSITSEVEAAADGIDKIATALEDSIDASLGFERAQLGTEAALADLQSAEAAAAGTSEQLTADRKRIADAERGVTAARVAAVRAAEDVTEAERGVTAAEWGLVRAHRGTEQAQRDLTQARADAARQLVDLSMAERGAKLDLADAEAALVQAKDDALNNTLADPTTAVDEAAQAARDVERAQLAVEQAKLDAADAAKANADAAAKGVEGSDTVLAAKEQLMQAALDEVAAADGVRDAHKRVTEALNEREAAMRAIGEAEGAVTAATAQFAKDQVEAQDAVRGATLDAQEAILGEATAAADAAGAGATAADKHQIFIDTLKDLSKTLDPAGDVYQRIQGLITLEQGVLSNAPVVPGAALVSGVGGLGTSTGSIFSGEWGKASVGAPVDRGGTSLVFTGDILTQATDGQQILDAVNRKASMTGTR